MACERWREMLSAQLDGEDDPVLRPLVDEHLAGCAGCRNWLERAATVNRLTRTAPVPAVPDLSDAILAALPEAGGSSAAGTPGVQRRGQVPSRRGQVPGVRRGRVPGVRWRVPVAALLYVALALVGAVQLILGLTQVGGGVSAGHEHAGLGATPGHLWHESAAWNVAVGAGYLFIALRRTRPTGLLPTLTAFVAMLLLLSVNDLTGGRVDVARLVGHGFVIIGYLLVVALARGVGGTARPPGSRVGTGWRARFDAVADVADDAPARPGLRLLPPPGPLTAQRAEQPGDRAA
ncbi:zf-HC2 domain-containing protein [Actinoplanes sp. DH11]|uniref:zf-HC2 domain-containing protein n=1 Tax=Actinoplanes sp. DH11 TaxID=2857011 RepID=UPI001E5A7A8E|nr:zf-HC2 domain-containing protein [Actinoplanes sp. DH11]